ncbi:hypothetical protein [Vibrio lentus]|uniref:hypothetical protein n=1 Tax=Vibrio lentus TaxID=136468 RepID=UPI000C83B36E|nr:hypothetical protein [Vibrio lentus]PMJ57862.1 hypothetical protein BCU20_17005 [Vibrio lentus]
MLTIMKLAEDLINDHATRKADRIALYALRDYLKERSKENLLSTNFDEFEFISLLSYLAKTKTIKARYTNAVAIRRLLGKVHKELLCFPNKPNTWPVPEKPTPEHFDPLSSEELEKFKEFISSEINAIYQKEDLAKDALENGAPLKMIGSSFQSRANPDKSLPKFSKWTGSINDAIATIHAAYPEYPNNTTKEMQEINGKYHIPKDLVYTNLTNPVVTLQKRLVMQKIKSFERFMEEHPDMGSSELIAILYPSLYEHCVIKAAICLETAWSPDIVERIDPNDFLYAPIPISGEWVFIKSKKLKGAAINNETNIRQQKVMIHPSSKSNPSSAYNLIKLLNKRTSRLRQGLYYDELLSRLELEHPFCLSLTINAGISISAFHPSLNTNRSAGQKYFVDKLGFQIDLRQLRPTRLYLNETEQNLPLLLQVALFGHSTSAITDGIYKENSAFKELRKNRLSRELNQVAESIRDGSFKGSLVPLLSKESIKKKIINIYTNHNGESPLAICNDSYNPTWIIKEKKSTEKEHCRQFNKCLLCAQSSVTNDNIPFIVDRFLYLDQMRRSVRKDQFDILYSEEFDAAKEVIDSWPYKEDINEAELRNAMEGYLLPPIISEYN